MRTPWILVCTAGVTLAQNTPDPKPWSLGPVDFSGLLDACYNLGYTSNAFRTDLNFGTAIEEMIYDNSTEVQATFVSLKPQAAKGFQLDLGMYATPFGAEAIETNNNSNYSQSLLFTLATPYTHFGARASMPVGKHFTAGFQVLNGWNNVEDNNSGKTVGFSGALNTSKVNWTHNYMIGPEKAGTNQGRRQIYDTTLLLTPTDKLNAYVNFDYAAGKRVVTGSDRWLGAAAAARYQAVGWFALSPRLEWYNDATGFNTGVVQKLKEVTITAEFKMKQGVLSRLEYRHDWSDQTYFNRGNHTANYRSQDTILIGIVVYFGGRS